MICIVCEKEIPKYSDQLYCELTIIHERWKHEAVDSSESYIMCSKKCLNKQLDSCLDVKSALYGYDYDIEIKKA